MRGSVIFRRGVTDIFGHVRDQCIEFLAGRAVERILLDGEPVHPTNDLRQARELAFPICSSDEVVETFIAIVSRIKRTMNGAEIDERISDVQARKARATELARRADSKRRELSARAFLPKIKSRE